MEQNDFENIAAAIRAKVLGVARHYGLSEEEAEDTAQDTMLKLWAMRGEIDRYRSVEALAVSIAAHLSVSVLRRQRPVTLSCYARRQTSHHRRLSRTRHKARDG